MTRVSLGQLFNERQFNRIVQSISVSGGATSGTSVTGTALTSGCVFPVWLIWIFDGGGARDWRKFFLSEDSRRWRIRRDLEQIQHKLVQ